MRLQANGLAIEIEDTGPVGAGLPVLLVMGLGMQLTAWPPAFVDALVRAGHRVIRFDNRDVGLSARLDHLGVPNLLWESMKLRFGLPVRAPYTLADMAADAFGVLDALGIGEAHVVGASMGGMIAQRMALAAPQRVRTLTSIMSSSGARHLPGPHARVLQVLLSRPKDHSEPTVLAHYVRLFQAIGSPGYPVPPEELRKRIRESLRRGGYRPAGSARQMAAIAADTTRAQELAGVKAPTLVLHGTDDPLLPIACGEDTARRIPGARLVAVPGLGHDLPPGGVERLLEPLLPHLQVPGWGMNSPEESQLGKPVAYPDRYDASLLYPMARAPKREEIGISGAPPFGADLWTAYELSWLNPRGKPQVALAHFTIPCETPNIVESKSLKLYLGSFNGTVFAGPEAVRERLRSDLGEAVWRGAPAPSSIGVRLVLPDAFDQEQVQELDGLSLDRLDIECTDYSPAPELLTAAFDEQPVEEVLTSNLLKSNCLVTGQPDWGSIQIRYTGPQIEQGGLLRYLVSFRNHNEFHEQCVERIFMDLWRRCRPTRLVVYARYTRRGGLDINPLRTSQPMALPPNVRNARQ